MNYFCSAVSCSTKKKHNYFVHLSLLRMLIFKGIEHQVVWKFLKPVIKRNAHLNVETKEKQKPSTKEVSFRSVVRFSKC